jgi:N-sulfoglucosamine sulfohydrolase
VRAIRTADWLFVRNLRPERWPAGDPKKWKAVGDFGDCDGGPSKDFVLADRGEAFFRLAFDRRPGRELYDLARDPGQRNNVAAEHPDVAARLDAELLEWLLKTADPRAAEGRLSGEDPRWDRYPYYGK